ncbi:hypothetical protein ACQJBY_062573 [Aegilops geniculata]
MAMWTGLGQAATVAQQLVGADIGGLISMIVQAALTARQNKRECEQLASRVLMIERLLPHVHDPEAAAPLAGLGDTLRDAHELAVSCQGRGVAYQFIMAGRQAERFKEVQSKIDFYLNLFSVNSHIGITRHLERIHKDLERIHKDLVRGGEPSPRPQIDRAQMTQKVVARGISKEAMEMARGISRAKPQTARIRHRDVHTVEAIQCISKAELQTTRIRDCPVRTTEAIQCISRAKLQTARISDCAIQIAEAISNRHRHARSPVRRSCPPEGGNCTRQRTRSSHAPP